MTKGQPWWLLFCLYLHAGQLHFTNGILSGDTDGNGQADFEIASTGVAANLLTASDFILQTFTTWLF